MNCGIKSFIFCKFFNTVLSQGKYCNYERNKICELVWTKNSVLLVGGIACFLFSVFVMMDELTKVPFTKLNMASTTQSNHWRADMLLDEESQRSGDENVIRLLRQWSLKNSPPNQLHVYVTAEGCHLLLHCT